MRKDTNIRAAESELGLWFIICGMAHNIGGLSIFMREEVKMDVVGKMYR